MKNKSSSRDNCICTEVLPVKIRGRTSWSQQGQRVFQDKLPYLYALQSHAAQHSKPQSRQASKHRSATALYMVQYIPYRGDATGSFCTPQRRYQRESFKKRICYNDTLHRTGFTMALKPPFLQRCKARQLFQPPSSIRAVSSEKGFVGSWSRRCKQSCDAASF